MNQPLLEIINLRVAYPSTNNNQNTVSWAVNDVSFNLNYGEILALVGESGCGKSTLGKALMGLLPENSLVEGKANFKGESIFTYDKAALRKFRGEAVALVFQDPMTRLDPLMTIGDHCLETLKAHQPQLSSSSAKEKVLSTLATVKISPERFNQYPHEFSGGMRQRVAIALALLLDPKLIIADEPTTSLDVTIASEILEELTSLCRDRDMALLLISHDLAMVGKYCDGIGVMYQGKMVEMGKVEDVIYSPNHEYTKLLLAAAFHLHQPTELINQENQENQTKTALLELKNLKQYYTLETNFTQQILGKKPETIKAVDDLNLKIWTGEILGLVGESGCGKSTLSRTILQLIRATAGQVNFDNCDLTTLSERKIRDLRKEIQMIFQDPHACLNPVMTIGESITEPLLIHRLGNNEENRQRVEKMLHRVGLNPQEYYNRYPKELSGGQQQRVAIARALITNPKLVICDEPVSMLDATVQAQVLDLILELKAEFNLTYLFITHDLSVARFLCDRIAVMNQGKIVELGETEEIFTNPQNPYTKTLLAAAPQFLTSINLH
ncbi:MAG: ABC transporter ATP-binding protein [Cyanobacteria bacterium]|nr:ABC transporter ATP-binding protein [Cyanobacteria bacterium CG_2015-16_32_12]NCO77406.1 ABC transporter ATP-binding protein [Cyanobacteria bacterium CG_2015-22_32_23]NCQ03482.1 ABC transporter ATP-binding protein [Cyanobacteria bacterium CG_2015-09_32_10]NCQ42263.1 ABC transporter ATP-binding protein [Cyanobacteria bacterium CG_2015-04_32_10]NCS83957.1 ABC transporter ATP-binding protein [Cyanobacteria bacterium CG_2015-02_32_10]